MRLDLHVLITFNVVFFSTWRLHGNRVPKTWFITNFISCSEDAERKKKRERERRRRRRRRRRRYGDVTSTADPCRTAQAALPKVTWPPIWSRFLDLSFSDLIDLSLSFDCARLLRFLDFFFFFWYFWEWLRDLRLKIFFLVYKSSLRDSISR